jgi:hypothetical protein|tara:strand:- start:85 stop:558 length:474 start_codon:yes stop_codon:yes gene_type:complete
MDVPRLNIEDLYETKKKIDLNRVEIYNKLLSKIHSKIKIASRQRIQNNFCSYLMPEILIGYPNYNFSECLNYIIDKLELDNFLCKYIHPNLLLISWNHWVPSYVREQIKKKTGVSVDSYGNEIKEKTTVTFNKDIKEETKTNIYGDKLMKSMKDLMH